MKKRRLLKATHTCTLFLMSAPPLINYIFLQTGIVHVKLVKVKIYHSNSPEVAKIPPTMPHNCTKNCQKGSCFSVTDTTNDDNSYLKKMPTTPWLPCAWLMSRSCEKRNKLTS